MQATAVKMLVTAGLRRLKVAEFLYFEHRGRVNEEKIFMADYTLFATRRLWQYRYAQW